MCHLPVAGKFLQHFKRRYIPQTCYDPGPLEPVNKVLDSIGCLSHVFGSDGPDALLLQSLDKPLRYSVAFRFTEIRQRRLHAKPAQFILELPTHVLGTMVVFYVPYYGPSEYSPETVASWISRYTREGFEGSKPRRRSDKGESRTIPKDVRQRVIQLREEKRDAPVTVFYDLLVQQEVLKPEEVSYSSLYRFLRTLGLAGPKQRKEPERKRFAYEKVNAVWQADISSGPYIKMGKRKVPTFLFAFLDDASRLVPYALYTSDQGFDSLKAVLKEVLSRRGIPQMIYTCD